MAELVEGRLLHDQPPGSLEEIIDLAGQVCTALDQPCGQHLGKLHPARRVHVALLVVRRSGEFGCTTKPIEDRIDGSVLTSPGNVV